MTDKPGEGWRVFANGEDFENVPLWKALAQFTSEDLDEGLRVNAAVINRERPKVLRNYNVASLVSISMGVLFLLALLAILALLLSAHTGAVSWLTPLTLILFVAALAPHLFRQFQQYGWGVPRSALPLPHAADRHFDEFLVYLQRASGPQAYYLSWFRKKRTFLSRQQFFGNLRYFLFSEDRADHGMVLRCGSVLPFPADVYLHRDDVQKMIAMSKLKRKAGPGRSAKYAYSDAIISLIGDPGLSMLDLSDRTAALRVIKNRLSNWFEMHSDASGDVPRGDLLAPYAEKIYERLKYFASSGRS